MSRKGTYLALLTDASVSESAFARLALALTIDAFFALSSGSALDAASLGLGLETKGSSSESESSDPPSVYPRFLGTVLRVGGGGGGTDSASSASDSTCAFGFRTGSLGVFFFVVAASFTWRTGLDKDSLSSIGSTAAPVSESSDPTVYPRLRFLGTVLLAVGGGSSSPISSVG